jgi:hypothetical protein
MWVVLNQFFIDLESVHSQKLRFWDKKIIFWVNLIKFKKGDDYLCLQQQTKLLKN